MSVWIVSAVYIALLALKARLAIRVARRTRAASPRAAVDRADAVIVQAILSGDPALASALEDNLVSLPDARFIWVVDEDDDAGRALTGALRTRYPDVRLDVVVVPQPPDRVNPKLFKLAAARSLIVERIVVVLDDDTRLPARTLAALLASLDTATLSTALPAYLDASTWQSRWLAAFVNNNAAITYLPMLAVWPAVSINGMAYAIKTTTLDRLGGFDAMRWAVTDDLAMAARVIAAGGTIHQSPEPVWIQTTMASVGQYVRIMHRWYVFALVLIANQAPPKQIVIAGAYATPPLLLGAALASTFRAFAPSHVAVMAVVLALRSLILIVVQRHLYGRALHRPVMSIISELMQPLHLTHALLRRTIRWRTRQYRVNLDQTFTHDR